MYLNAGTGNHWHTDNLSAIVYGYGNRLIIDPGRYSYNYAEPVTDWIRRSTEAHNTIEINNTDQIDANQTIKSWISNGSYDFFNGYCVDGDFTHYRKVLFVKPNYWIASDYLEGTESTNTYQQAWHYLPSANPTMDGTSKKTETNFTSEANIQIVPLDPASFSEASLEDGYYSPIALTVQDAEYTLYEKQASGNVTFDTVLYPTDTDDTSRNVTVTRLSISPSVATTIATAFSINMDDGNGGDIGYYYLSHEEQTNTARTFSTYSYNGEMAYIQTTNGGTLKSALIKSGDTLTSSGSDLITSLLSIEEIGIKWDGNVLEIEGSNLTTDTSSTAIKIYAPNATSVKLNGSTVSFSKVGNYVYAVRQAKISYIRQDDFSSTQGYKNWYYQKYNGSTYSNLPEYDSSQARWENTSGTFPIIASSYMRPGSTDDAVQKWVAPCAGVVNLNGAIKSASEYEVDDGNYVKIMKNGTQIWPESGWEYIARDDIIGINYNVTVSVSQNDAIYLVMNRISEALGISTRWACDLTLYPYATYFSDDFEDGNANGWTPLNAGRWSVGTDDGDYSYYINTTSFDYLSGQRLGELSLINGSDYTDFLINLEARFGDDVSSNGTADFDVVFNYQDANNYYYMMFNNGMIYNELFKVKNGTRTLIGDTVGLSDWLDDNDYHLITIERDSSSGEINVYLDNEIIIRARDYEFNGGQIGIGSYNDSAYFDDIAVIEIK